MLDRLVLQPVTHRAAQGVQLNRLKRGRVAALVQLGQTDDVLDQRQQPARLGADFARKRRDVLGPHNAVFHDLGIAHDAGQRGFELVRNVGGELLPLAFRLIALGDIHNKQHRGVALSVLCDRACRQRVNAPVLFHAAVCALAGQCVLNHADVLRIAAQRHVAALRAVLREQCAHRAIGKQNIALRGEQHQPLVHAGGDVVKLRLSALEFVQLGFDLVVLLIHAVQQRGKLIIRIVFERRVQVERNNRLEEHMGQPACQQRSYQQRQQNNHHNPR